MITKIMAQESKSILDYVSLVLAAIVVTIMALGFLWLLDKSNILAYALALLALVCWAVAAPVAAPWLIKNEVSWVLYLAWGSYVLLLAYVVGHRLPFPGFVGYINSHNQLVLGIIVGFSAVVHTYLMSKRRKKKGVSSKNAPTIAV